MTAFVESARPAFRAGESPAEPREPAGGLVLRLQAAVLSHPRLADAATAFASGLAEAMRCERVSLGLTRHGSVRLLALSSGRTVESRSDAGRALSAVMNEAFDQKATLCFPPPDAALPLITQLHQRLIGGSGAAGILSIPLMNLGRIVGIVTLERTARAFADWEVALAEDAACFAGPLIELKREAEEPWFVRLGGALRARLALVTAPGHGLAKLAFWTAVALMAGATLVPLPYRVSAPARLEGSVQRAIVAPADGFLRQANVRAGDRVHAGQVLAELAGEDLALERQRRESELRQHENAYRGALARADRGQMVIHQAKAGEAQALLTLIEGQIERAKITAPFDGVVIKGDLTQNLGAPVQRGEVLLTIAPSDRFRLIVEVDEADIGAIETGQAGRLALAARPDQTMGLAVRRIVPVATAADARNYFEVEAELDGAGQALRPGLRGVAKIDAGQRSALWMLTHRAVAWLALALWSIAP